MFAASRLRTAASCLMGRTRTASRQLVPARQSSAETWYYRELNANPPRRVIWAAEGLMGLMWYWVLWHCWYEWDHLVGGHTLPDPSKWTDEELGIPPDSED